MAEIKTENWLRICIRNDQILLDSLPHSGRNPDTVSRKMKSQKLQLKTPRIEKGKVRYKLKLDDFNENLLLMAKHHYSKSAFPHPEFHNTCLYQGKGYLTFRRKGKTKKRKDLQILTFSNKFPYSRSTTLQHPKVLNYKLVINLKSSSFIQYKQVTARFWLLNA